jgi:hypothetical protein
MQKRRFNMQTVKLKLADIVDAGTQMRVALDNSTVHDYVDGKRSCRYFPRPTRLTWHLRLCVIIVAILSGVLRGEDRVSQKPTGIDAAIEVVERLKGELELAVVDKQTTLRVVRLMDSKVTDDDLAKLAGLPGLEELYLSRTAIGDRGLAHIAKMKSLQRLDLFATLITDEGFAQLKDQTELVRLGVGDTQLTGDAADTIGRMTKLEQLYISRVPITDDAIGKLKNLKELKELDIFNAALSDKGLASIAENHPKLTRLGISGARITEASLASLEKLKSLDELYLTARIPQEALDAFAKKHPLSKYQLRSLLTPPKQ